MGEQRLTIALNGSDLTVTQVVAAARHGEPVALAPEAIAAMRRSRAIVQDVLAGGREDRLSTQPALASGKLVLCPTRKAR